MNLAITYLTILILAAPSAVDPLIVEAVNDHYDSVIAGRAVAWEIEIKRCPVIQYEDIRVVEVRSEEYRELPRGSKLCWVDVVLDGQKRSLPLSVIVKPVELVPVSRFDISSRTVLSDSLITWEEVATENLGAAKIPRKEELNSLWAKVRIPEGTILTEKRLDPIPAVEIGQDVSLVTQIGSVEVKTRARCMQDGLVGERVKVENINSGRRIRGRVTARGVVEVE